MKTHRVDEDHILLPQLNLSLAVSVDRARLSRLEVEKTADRARLGKLKTVKTTG
jgi:hypothetical protein